MPRIKRQLPMTPPPKAKAFKGIPSFFRACCQEASFGGGNSYRVPGWHLAIHISELESYEYDDENEFQARIAALQSLLSAGNRRAVLEWLVDEYPRCLQLVPRRRRQTFLDGVFDAFGEGRIP